MKTTSFALAFAVAAALTVPAARDVQAAASGIQKCRAADGSTLYTDKPCDAFGAAPAPLSQELGMRLASEPATPSTLDTAGSGDLVLSDAVLPGAHGTPTGRRSLAAGCARAATQLAMDVQASVGLHDVNRLAESYHWVGMSHRESMPVMQRLERLSRSRIVDARVHAPSVDMGLQFADASGEMYQPSAGTLLLSLQGETGVQSMQLNVEQYAGCYFARF